MRHPLIFTGKLGQINNIMEKSIRPNRIREALGHLNDEQPTYFREYLRRFQEDPTSRVFAPLAEAYRRLGKFEDAVLICLEGMEHHPDFHAGRVVLAKCYFAQGKFTEARGELERVVHSVPENLLGQRLLGDTYLALGNRSAALHCYKMALLLSPADVALAEKVHELESGASVFVNPQQQLEPLNTLPESASDLETEIPPLWGGDFSSVPAAVEPKPFDEPMGLQSLGLDDESTIDDEAFKIEHVSTVFDEEPTGPGKEITTETLGDLYFSQGQYEKAIRIFEKLRPTASLSRKVQLCRARLGVDVSSLLRQRKIALLRRIVERARDFS